MPSYTPWKDFKWLPGVLNKKQMVQLMEAHLLLDASPKDLEEDASALDLHLSDQGYKMIKGSIKPFSKSYKDVISDPYYAESMPNSGIFSLEKGQCYVFKINERLHPCIKTAPVYGQATAKSTVGRVDVIARLIVDGMKEYETFIHEEVNSGEMFLEITPITFNVKIKPGESISQLRFFYGKIEYSIINDEGFINSILNLRDGERNHGTLSVDISKVQVSFSDKDASAIVAKKDITEEIELWKKVEKDRYSPNDFWELEGAIEKNGLKSIQIKKDRFYILRSVEQISLPKGVCIYCRAMDETLGEMRIHYAGFVHPLFGTGRKDGKPGAPLIFEVRGHNVDVLLTHREILARLFFYRMSDDVDEDAFKKKKEEEESKKGKIDNYSNQELTLSKFFKEKEEKIDG